MKQRERSIARGLLLAACALSTGLFAACSQDAETDAYAPGGTDVEVTATISGMVGAITRSPSGSLQSTAFATSLGASAVAVKVDDGNGTYSDAYQYTISGGTTITAPTPKPQFPGTVLAVNVYGWYPYNGGSGTFTIAADQTTDETYVANDIMMADVVQCSRAKSGSVWNVTEAQLQFKHVMSKIAATVTPGTGVTLKKVEIIDAYPTMTIALSGSNVTATGSGTLQAIKLWESTAGSTDDQITYGLFAPKSYSGGTFIKVTAVVGGKEGVVNFTASQAFAAGNVYSVSLPVNATDIGHTVEITDWTTGTAPDISLGTV